VSFNTLLPPFEKYLSLLPLVLALWWVVFSFSKVYHSKRLTGLFKDLLLVTRAHFLAVLIFIFITYLFNEYKFSRGMLFIFSMMGWFFLIALRLIVRTFLRKLRKRGYNLRHLILIGEGPTVDQFVRRIQRYPEMGFHLIGSLSPGPVPGLKHLGTYQEAQSIVRSLTPDQVLIAIPRKQDKEFDLVLKQLHDEVVDLILIPDLHQYITLGCEVEDFDGLPMVNINDSPLDGWGGVIKRITDFILSFLALFILSPLLIMIGILVKLTSKGPIFYGQERMGLDGQTFKMYKFRSMKTDAEQSTGAVWAVQNDPRRTRFGTFLRSTSLDELPQFWNVLVGQMSLVGPRPERPVFVEQFREEIPHYMLRHKVKAGITGWAQVNGWRGDTSLEKRIECDLYYIRHWSYSLDIKILFLTVFKGFVNKNAY
jgi:Undecaprenyl-phosphate glucose phosphotransferase